MLLHPIEIFVYAHLSRMMMQMQIGSGELSVLLSKRNSLKSRQSDPNQSENTFQYVQPKHAALCGRMKPLLILIERDWLIFRTLSSLERARTIIVSLYCRYKDLNVRNRSTLTSLIHISTTKLTLKCTGNLFRYNTIIEINKLQNTVVQMDTQVSTPTCKRSTVTIKENSGLRIVICPKN